MLRFHLENPKKKKRYSDLNALVISNVPFSICSKSSGHSTIPLTSIMFQEVS